MGNEAIDYINRDIVNVKNELHTISKLVRDGNGQPSLIQQVASLRSDVNGLETELHVQLNEIQKNMDSCKAAFSEKSRISWQFKAVIIAALISSITSVFIHFSKPDVDERQKETERLLHQLLDKLDRNALPKK